MPSRAHEVSLCTFSLPDRASLATCAMLAARGQGVGSAMTTVLGRYRAHEMMEVLGAPADSGWVNVCCLSFGYPLGRWATAQRVAVGQVAFRNQWGAPLGQEISGPLWPPPR
jgi:hypothetical protein